MVLILCLAWATSYAQKIVSKIQLHYAYMPQFTVREASDSNVQPFG